MRSGLRTRLVLGSALTLALGAGSIPDAAARSPEAPLPPTFDKDSHGVLATKGEFVHNVGELQLNITNWGLIGSHPNGNTNYSEAPSAMWPAGSGVDYLYEAGLWVGAVKNGVPLVTTGVGGNRYELSANPEDPLETIYTTYQGALGGARYPDPSEDDDEDGSVNEDPLNGLDDDGDGLVDEDFAAIGTQHFRCTMRDDTALVQEFYPDHDPLGLRIVQESFQWESDAVDDFIGFQFGITNVGVAVLENVALGFFADGDVGPRSGDAIFTDDVSGYFEGAIRAQDGSMVPISIAYIYDDDGDGGQTLGYFGTLFLGHPIDPSGATAPQQVGITSFQTFSGRAPFDRGGDPNNDAERYELMSRVEIDPSPGEDKAADYRVLLSVGLFEELAPGETLEFQAGMVVGEGLAGLLTNAAEAALTFYGGYFDRDGDPSTGRKGRETRICEEELGSDIFTVFLDCVDSLDLAGENPPSPIQPQDLDDDGCTFANLDCSFEERRGNENCHLEGEVAPEQLAGCTGVLGQEHRVPWLVGLAPSAPNMRLWKTDRRVHVFFNNLSELVPDVRLQEVDFESYRIWRAEGWDRPYGTSIENGPESALWRLVAEYDVVDYFDRTRRLADGSVSVETLPLGANTGLEHLEYTPLMERPGTPEYDRAGPARDLVHRILDDPEFTGQFSPTIPPEKAIRSLDAEGQVTRVGMAYPELRAIEQEYGVATLDTLYSLGVGIRFYEFVDRDVHNGLYYFYAVTATDFAASANLSGELQVTGPGLVGDPQTNFEFAIPVTRSQTAEERSRLGQNIYVVPNPATRESLAEFSQLRPNSEDPTGVRVMFSNLPASRCVVKIYTISGDLVNEIQHDGTQGNGSAFWNLISRNGQEVVSGVYLYSVEARDPGFDRVVGRFVVVR